MELLAKTIVKDGYLTCPTALPEFKARDVPFVRELLARVERRLKDGGDNDVIVNAELGELSYGT